jgi:hypothetical protein
VEESDLAPDDGQTPKYDERLLDDVGAGDPRHRLSFAIEPHWRETNSFRASNRRGINCYNKGKQSPYSQSLSPLSASSPLSAPLAVATAGSTSLLTFSPLSLPETTS